MKIGFNRQKDYDDKKKLIQKNLEKLDQDFMNSIKELKIEEHILEEELKIEKKLQKELFYIHNMIKDINDKFQIRQELIDSSILFKKVEKFEKERDVLKKVFEIDREITKELDFINNQIKSYYPQEIAEINKSYELSKDEILKIQIFLDAIRNQFNLSESIFLNQENKNYLDNRFRELNLKLNYR